jgi:hypothetical protein
MKDLALTVGGTQIQTPGGLKSLGGASLNSILSGAVTILIVFAIILTLFYLISGGIDMITSGGDKQKVVNSRHKLTYAVIGLVVVFLSFLIINVIGGIFGVEPLGHPNIPPLSEPCFKKPC